MRTSLFRRVFILYGLVALVTVSLVEVYIASDVRNNYIEGRRKDLGVQITLMSKGLSFSKGNLDDLCRQLGKDTSSRVTVIAPDGRVLGDSDTDSSRMDNHRNRTEIEQALLFDTGMAIRYSDTLRHDFLYVAKKIERAGSSLGFVRMAVPLKEVDAEVGLLRLRIILVVLLVFLATWLVAVWQTEHLRRLLRQVIEFSKSLSQGKIEKRLFLKDAGEFEEIAANLTTMSGKLQESISRSEEEKNRLSVILRSIPDALLIIDIKGVIMLCSMSAREFFGDVGFIGRQYLEVVRNHAFADLLDEVAGSLLQGTTTLRMESPSEKYIRVTVSPLFYRDDELSGYVAIFHDITEVEKLEQVRKDFVANVSHELKTPITAIRGFADTLLDGALEDPENAAKFVETIRSNSERINDLVDDLMTISKIELGVVKVEKSLIDTGDVFRTIIDLFKTKAASKNLILHINMTQDMSRIEADRNRLIQILTNLVDNAIKFTDTGGVTLGIGMSSSRSFLYVEDTGIGVPAKYLARLGERFFRVDPARSRKMGGTGLGLAIVKHLVKAHGWTLQIESAQGKGTCVKIFL